MQKRGIANSTKFARTSETIKTTWCCIQQRCFPVLNWTKKSKLKTQESVSNLKDPASLPLLIFTRIGDRLGAIPSASIKFEILKDRFLSQGFTEEVAIAKADRGASTFLNKTQQSDLLSEADLYRTSGNTFHRIFSQFLTSANFLWRQEMATILNYSAGRISAKQAAKNILIYHFMIPSLIQAISDGFRFDEKNQIRSWILGGFNGMYIVGSLANNALFSLINGINFGTVEYSCHFLPP